MRDVQCVLNSRRIAAIGTSVLALATLVGFGYASARNDDGSKTFFQSMTTETASAPAAAPVSAAYDRTSVSSIRHRVVHAEHQHARVATARPRKVVVVARGSDGAPALTIHAEHQPVTMYTDATLKPGDAVMTASGIRIFAGSKSFPYNEQNFVGVKEARGLSRTVLGVLASLNSLPRG